MPVLRQGSSGEVVRALQTLLTNGASGAWNVTPQGIDGNFGPHTKASVQAFQTWGGVASDGVVGDQTWAVSLHAASATLETAVGLIFASGPHADAGPDPSRYSSTGTTSRAGALTRRVTALAATTACCWA